MWACDRAWFWTLLTTCLRSLKEKFASPEFLMSSYLQRNDSLLLKGPHIKLPLTWAQLVWSWAFNQCSPSLGLPLPFFTSTTLILNQYDQYEMCICPHTPQAAGEIFYKIMSDDSSWMTGEFYYLFFTFFRLLSLVQGCRVQQRDFVRLTYSWLNQAAHFGSTLDDTQLKWGCFYTINLIAWLRQRERMKILAL